MMMMMMMTDASLARVIRSVFYVLSIMFALSSFARNAIRYHGKWKISWSQVTEISPPRCPSKGCNQWCVQQFCFIMIHWTSLNHCCVGNIARKNVRDWPCIIYGFSLLILNKYKFKQNQTCFTFRNLVPLTTVRGWNPVVWTPPWGPWYIRVICWDGDSFIVGCSISMWTLDDHPCVSPYIWLDLPLQRSCIISA